MGDALFAACYTGPRTDLFCADHPHPSTEAEPYSADDPDGVVVVRLTFDLQEAADGQIVTLDLENQELWQNEVIARDPDYLILPRTHSLQASFERLVQEDPWRRLRAVRENRIVWLDDAVLRPGPRIVDAIEELARALHPAAWSRQEKAQK